MKSIRKTLGGIRRSRAADRERRECAKRVAAAAGWSEERAMKALLDGKEKGISYVQYEKKECWKLDESGLQKEIDRLERFRKDRERYIDEVAGAAGWTHEHAETIMRSMHKNGIKYSRYAHDHVYELDDDELKEYKELAGREKNLEDSERAYYADLLRRRTGWTEEQAAERMKAAGIDPAVYVLEGRWNTYSRRVSGLQHGKNSDDSEEYIEQIMENTGLGRGRVCLDMMRSRMMLGADAADHSAYRLSERNYGKESSLITRVMFDRMKARYNEACAGRYLFDDRVWFNCRFSRYIKRRWFLNRGLTYDEFRKRTDGLSLIAVYGRDGTCAHHAVPQDDEGRRALCKSLMTVRGNVVEEAEDYDERTGILTLADGEGYRLLFAVFTGKDGIYAPLDTVSGRLNGDGTGENGADVRYMPGTEIPFRGYAVRGWDDMKDMALRLSEMTEGAGLVFWEFIFTDRGAELVAAQADPPYRMIQAAAAAAGIDPAEEIVLPHIGKESPVRSWDSDHLKMTWCENLREEVRHFCGTADADARISEAWDLGINAESFVYYRAWLFSSEELKEFRELLDMDSEKKKSIREWYVKAVAEKSGCSTETARKRINHMRKRGYTARRFITMGLYGLSDEELEDIGPAEKKPYETASFADRNSEADIEMVMKEMDISYGRCILERLRARIVAGVHGREWILLKLYRLTAEECRAYLTTEIHLKMQLRYCDYKGGWKSFEDKELFDRTFERFIKRRWFVMEDMDFEEFSEKIRGLDRIVVKPVDEVGGHGVAKFDVGDKAAERAAYEEITARGRSLVEQSIEGLQARVIADIWPHTLNTLRVYTLNTDGECHVLMTAIRVGSGMVADNFHQGGVAAAIDTETGIICTHAADLKGRLYKVHEKSGKPFKGVRIPYWDRVLETVREASAVVPDMPYVGWDICVREDGQIELLEGNHDPMATMVQYSYALSEGQGIRYMVEPYYDFED